MWEYLTTKNTLNLYVNSMEWKFEWSELRVLLFYIYYEKKFWDHLHNYWVYYASKPIENASIAFIKHVSSRNFSKFMVSVSFSLSA